MGLDDIEIIMALEEEFFVDLDDEALNKWDKTIIGLARIIQEKDPGKRWEEGLEKLKDFDLDQKLDRTLYKEIRKQIPMLRLGLFGVPKEYVYARDIEVRLETKLEQLGKKRDLDFILLRVKEISKEHLLMKDLPKDTDHFYKDLYAGG